MSTTRIGALAVRWILESPRAKEELRLVDPGDCLLAAMRLLDSSFTRLVDEDPHLAHTVADIVDDFHDALRSMG